MRLVVVADDDPGIRSLLVTALREELGVDARGVADGERLLTIVANARPDAILLDVMMPVLDGLAAARRLKADPATAAIPIVAMSAAANQRAVLATGCCDFVGKPFDLQDVLDAVARALG
jgi:CheY-like chemotaxis protein